MTVHLLSQCPGVDGVRLDLVWISRHLWTFLGPRLGDDVYGRRVQMAGGEENNGLELWRKMFMDNEGGAEQVALAELRRFHSFPVCPSKDKIGLYLGEWVYLRNRYGGNLPDESLYVMLINMLPSDIAKEIRDRRKTLTTTVDVIAYINGELGRYNDEYLAKLHSNMDYQNLQKGPEHPIHMCIEDKISSVESKLDEFINAVNSAPPPPRQLYQRPTKGDKGKGKGDKGDGT